MLYIRDFVLKVVVLFPFVALLVFGAVTPPDLNKHWQSHKVKYGKSYTSPQDEISRRLIFEDNFKKIEKHNTEYRLGRHSYFLGVNKFADNTHEEFLRILKKFHLNTTKEFTFLEPSHIGNLPRYVDWRKKGAVTPVKDQRDCGSCWAYSATGALEAQHFKRTGKLVALSEQNLVDCSRNWGNHGCYGGFMHLAFQYVKDNGGIDTENSYPYEAEEQECSFTKANIGAISRGYTNIPTGNETVLAYAVATVGPIAVAIDSSYESFKLYKGGIYDEPNCSTTDLSHAVLVVGYGTKNGKDYWIVKNSWGAEWGEKGYILMSRNKNNQCGIATLATYPLI